MIKKLATYINKFGPEAGPFVVGVTDIDASGKSSITTLLEQELTQLGCAVQVIRLDDFHRLQIDRYREGVPEPDKYYEQSFDIDRLINDVLGPIRENGELIWRSVLQSVMPT